MEREHPTLRIKATKGKSLLGKKIVLGVTGSIAAVRTVEIARELVRYGADVYAVMSEAATEIIHPYALHYATGHEVITKLMGNIEHVEFLGMEGTADLFLIAPCTANTLGKIACAIDDTPVTTFATTAFGSGIPIMVVPAMHETMYNHPILQEHIRKLEKLGVLVVGPKFEEKKAKIAEIERESLQETGLRSEVVSLYRGGEYWLYRYKKYTDVRLVMVPERQAAYFGGDWDNFTYPRYDLDIAFLRVWEKGRPLRSKHYLRWNPEGVKEGDLVFVSGNPGSTKRLNTMVQLTYLREKVYPARLRYIARALAALERYAQRGPEQRRRALVHIFGYRNAQKALQGELAGLCDSKLMEKRARAEKELREKIETSAELRRKYGWAWQRIEELYRTHGERYSQLRYQTLAPSRLGTMAVTLVRYVKEVEKPDSERLDGFHESELPQLRFHLFSQAPIYRDLEAVLLEVAFREALDNLPAGHAFSKAVSALGNPAEASRRLIFETELVEVDFRKSLAKGGRKAVEKCRDPLIVFARHIEPITRKAERWREKVWESVLTPASEAIAQARFAVYGKKVYPDATFTLRLSFGPVAGYPMNGTKAPYKTTLYGLFDRALSFDCRGDWQLPHRFWLHRGCLDLSTPVNFVCECDITGGNSGSPVINTKGELVGLIFDGNIESFPNEFWYDGSRARAVAVHSAYVIEALIKLYDAKGLVEELLKQSKPEWGED